MRCGDPDNPSGPCFTSRGTPCRLPVRAGFTRCQLHGGATPAAKIKAETMLAQARLPAIEALFEILDQFHATTCAMCGFPKGDADEKRMIIQTCKTVLDRTGMGPHATLELAKQSDGDLNLELLSPDERLHLLDLLAQVKAIKRTVRERQSGLVGVEIPSAPDAAQILALPAPEDPRWSF
jgi:hypothetical protein